MPSPIPHVVLYRSRLLLLPRDRIPVAAQGTPRLSQGSAQVEAAGATDCWLSSSEAITRFRRPPGHELNRGGAICSLARPPGRVLSSGWTVSRALAQDLSCSVASRLVAASQSQGPVLSLAETRESEAAPLSADGVPHGQEQLVLVLLLLHHPAEVKHAFVLNITPAKAV
ncbi:hypothetical protein E2C01_034142 [Portunus trituberculatus]|uniref:Uncharacterized protein n=1 Tax=Portunus trituberculatus TaxID=210409 RepID=A0A5B7F0P3_PORTR|nr:hypothetical protein [Portunus trituberculatus]